MYHIVPVAPGEQQTVGGASDSPLKKKRAHEGRPLVLAGMLGCVLVLAAVVAWCYYSASVRKAQLLKNELLDLNKDGFIIRNQAGAVIFTMTFRWVLCRTYFIFVFCLVCWLTYRFIFLSIKC